MLVAEIYLTGLGAYLLVGLLFALWFLTMGGRRLDPDLGSAGLTTRLLLLPGTTLLWPVLLRRLFTGAPV